MRDPRMSRRLSQAPRLSLVWTAINIDNSAVVDELEAMADDGDTKRGSLLRDFCSNHIKSISTVILMFGMIFCIVMIVIIHKWNYETNEEKYVSACHDIAIIGAGLSGSYAAWKLRHSPLDIHVYETSHRIGGMFHTLHSAEFPDLYLDVGVTSYNTKQQPLLTRTIHAMQPVLHTYPQQNQDQRGVYYLRGKYLTKNDFKSSTNSPYNLTDYEHYRANTPADLQKSLFKEILESNTSLLPELEQLTKDGLPLYQQGFENVMRKVSSQEGWNLLRDTAQWRHLVSNNNAALLAHVIKHNNNNNNNNNNYERVIDGGMKRLPEEMIQQFATSCEQCSHDYTLNRRLACIREKHGVFQLIFIKTAHSDGGQTVDLRDSQEICARKVILAIPPSALENLEWSPYDSRTTFQESLNSVQEYPVLRVYFIYSNPWWPRDSLPPHQDIYTDLPIRHVKYLGNFSSTSQQKHHVFMTAEIDGHELSYLRNLLKIRKFDGNTISYCNNTKYLRDEISRNLAELFGQDITTFPHPNAVLIEDWSEKAETGSWYVWKRGVLWDSVASNISKPADDKDVFIVGSAFCNGVCQLSAEGAIKTVDDVIEKYFKSDE